MANAYLLMRVKGEEIDEARQEEASSWLEQSRAMLYFPEEEQKAHHGMQGTRFAPSESASGQFNDDDSGHGSSRLHLAAESILGGYKDVTGSFGRNNAPGLNQASARGVNAHRGISTVRNETLGVPRTASGDRGVARTESAEMNEQWVWSASIAPASFKSPTPVLGHRDVHCGSRDDFDDGWDSALPSARSVLESSRLKFAATDVWDVEQCKWRPITHGMCVYINILCVYIYIYICMYSNTVFFLCIYLNTLSVCAIYLKTLCVYAFI